MVDIETKLYDTVSTALQAEIPEAFVTGKPVAVPSSFPCVSIVELGNTTYRRSLAFEPVENHANLMYEIQVFSNKSKTSKAECRKIFKIIDYIMIGLYFTRTMLQPITNATDPSVYRLVGRYTAVAAPDGLMYRK